jgi:opacity protein-like surface antigen
LLKTNNKITFEAKHLIYNFLNNFTMKKSLLTSIFCFVIFINIASAQFGVRASANLANLSVDPVSEDFKPGIKFGFGIGVFYQLKAGDALTIQPEVNFMQQGTKTDVSILGINATSSINLNYLQVPVLIKYGFGDMDALNFFVQAGPYLGLGIGTPTAKTCLDGTCDSADLKYGSGDDDIKSTDFGVQLGAGVNVNKNISVDVRYGLGLSNTSNGDSANGTTKNTAINIGVGYKF